MVAFLAVAMLVIVAFTTDFGMAYAQRRALATGADSAALGIVQSKYKSQLLNTTRTCDQIITQDAALTAGAATKASTIALNQINANAPFGATLLAADVTTTLSCSGVGVLQVAVAVNRAVNPIFGKVLNASAMQISRQAVAALGVANDVTGLLPITVCTNQANAIMARHAADVLAGLADGAQLVPLNKVWASGTSCDGGGGSGNWGWLDFGKGVNVPDLVDYISGAYPAKITIPLPPMDGTPGNKGNSSQVVDAMQALIDLNKVVTLPVYSTVSGSGANTKYAIVGFLSVKVCGYRDNSKEATSTTCYDSTAGVKLTDNTMQIRYVDYVPVGQIGTVCAIGGTCAYNAYVTKLLG